MVLEGTARRGQLLACTSGASYPRTELLKEEIFNQKNIQCHLQKLVKMITRLT